MDIGEHPAGDIGRVFVFTNADSVRLYKNDVFVKEFFPCRDEYPALPHPPVIVDDFIGGMLETQEHFEPKVAADVKDCLNAIAKYGPSALPAGAIAKFAKLMLFKGFKFSDGYELYGRYVSNWGGEATVWRFDAVKNGEVVKSVIKMPGQQVQLEISVSSTHLTEGDTYDAAAVRIRALDGHGNPAVYWQEPIALRCDEGLEIIGPHVISLKGGSGGTYVKTCGVSGNARLYVGDIAIEFEISVQPDSQE